MSEAKQNLSVFIVMDRSGRRHSVMADRMLTDGREVTFTVLGREVGSFFDPLSAKVSAPDAEPVELAELVPGAAVTVFRPRWSRLDWLIFGALVVNVALMAYDQFVRPLV